MELISWTQTDKIVIASAPIEQNVIKFKIESKIINNIVNHTPPIFFFKVVFEGKTYDFIIDFTGLKPVIKQSQKLSFKVKTDKPAEKAKVASSNYYCIARGESFMERFLGIEGWQAQEYNFGIFLLDEQNTEPVLDKPEGDINTKFSTPTNFQKEQEEQVSVSLKAKSKETFAPINECKNCGTKVSDDIDICPNCFENLFTPEKDVDFAL